jgi:hypothetical protein
MTTDQKTDAIIIFGAIFAILIMFVIPFFNLANISLADIISYFQK